MYCIVINLICIQPIAIQSQIYPLRFDSVWIRSDQGFVCLTLVGKKVNATFSRCIIVHRTSL